MNDINLNVVKSKAKQASGAAKGYIASFNRNYPRLYQFTIACTTLISVGLFYLDIYALYAHASEWWAFVKKWWYKGSVGRWSSRESTMRNGGGGGTRMAKRQSIQKNKRLAFVMAATIICAVTVTGPMVVRADGKGHYRRSTGTCEAWVSESDCPGLADGWSGVSWGGTVSSSDAPPGCYYDSWGGGNIYYNTNTNNDCSADGSRRACLCQCIRGRYSNTAEPPQGECPNACAAGTVLASVEHSSAILYSYRTVLVYTVLLLTPYEPPALRICTVFAQLSGKYGDQTGQSSCKSCGIGEYEHALNDLLTYRLTYKYISTLQTCVQAGNRSHVQPDGTER